MPISLIIADHHPVTRLGLANVFQNTEIQVVAEASGGDEAIKRTVKHKPDVVLLDVQIADRDALSVLNDIMRRKVAPRVVMFGNDDNPTYVARSVVGGASAYLTKSSSGKEIVATIKRVAKDQAPPDTNLFARMNKILMEPERLNEEGIKLTRRETQVAMHIGVGLSNREIATSLGISIETVKEHVQNILRKVGKRDRTQVAVLLWQNGLLEW